MAPSLTEEQRAVLERRKASFDAYFGESMPALVDFCTRLKLPEPYRVVNSPSVFLGAIDAWLAGPAQTSASTPEDRTWLAARLAYYTGYLLTERFGGNWFVDENPQSRYFARYVVGQFAHRPAVRVDPTEVAMAFLSGNEGKSFSAFFATIIQAVSAPT
ncbi:MAG: hypothetical protein P4L99_26870 [Chthoniobacter sp.]|nr:hypothetical protein [Chthoniobacter sp.]